MGPSHLRIALLGVAVVFASVAGAQEKKFDKKATDQLLKAAKTGTAAEVSAALKKKADVNGTDEAGNTPLAVAAGAGKADLVQALIAAGAAVDKANPAGITPVMTAAQNGRAEVAKALLAAGADKGGADKRGRTLVFHAIRGGCEDLAKELIAGGADVNARNEDQKTLLHEAAGDGRLEVVRVLLAAKVDVNAKEDREGATPLMLAAGEGNVEVIQELLKAKADMAAANSAGRTAFDIATDAGHEEAAALLKPRASGKTAGKAGAKPAGAPAASRGAVDHCDGTLTVEGKTTKLVHAYLYPDTGTPPAVNLFLSDVPVDRKTLQSSFSIQDLSDNGRLHLVKIRITTGDKQPTSSEVYDSGLRNGRTGVVGAGDFKASTFTAMVIEGTVSMPKPREVPEGTYQYKASFRATLHP